MLTGRHEIPEALASQLLRRHAERYRHTVEEVAAAIVRYDLKIDADIRERG